MKFGLEHMKNYTAQKSENSTVKQKESLFTLKKNTLYLTDKKMHLIEENNGLLHRAIYALKRLNSGCYLVKACCN